MRTRQITMLSWLIASVPGALAGTEPVPSETQAQVNAEKSKPRVDQFGDPLPPGALYRIGTTRLHLTQGIGAIAASPDGKLVAALGTSTLAVWEVWDGREVCRISFTRATDSRLLVFSPDGKSLACNCEGALCLIDAATGRIRRTLSDPAVHAAFVSADKSLTTVTWEAAGVAAVRCWDVETGQLIRRWDVRKPPEGLGPMLKGLSLSADGTVVAMLESDWLDPKKENQTVRVLDVPTGAEIHRWRLGDAMDVNVALSEDGKLLAAKTRDWTLLRVWETASGKELGRCKIESLGNAIAAPSLLTFTPDGASILCSGRTGLTRWDWRAGKQLREYRETADPVAFLGTGKAMAIQAWPRRIRFIDVETGKDVSPLPRPGNHLAFSQLPPPANHVAFSSDPRLAAWAEEDEIVLADAASGKVVRRWPAEALHELVLAFAPDGKSLVSVACGYRMCLWEVASGRKIREFGTRDQQSRVHWLFFSRDGRRLASGNDREACIWDVASGDRIGRWEGTHGAVVAPNFQTVAVTGQAGRALRLIDPAAKKADLELPGYHGIITSRVEGAVRRSIQTHSFFRPLFSPDARLLLASGESAIQPEPGALYLWDVASGKRLPRLLHGGKVLAHRATFSREGLDLTGIHSVAAFSPDSRLLTGMTSDSRIGLLSTVTGEFVRMLPQDERSMSVPPAFTPDGRTLVTVIGGLIQFWEVATGGEIAVRKPSDDIVRALFISADSLRVATASPDDTILVWDLAHLMTNNPPTAIPLGTLWNDLASADAASGRRAVEMLSMVPTDAVPLLRARIKPVPHATAQQITRWIADLGSDDFEVRQQAEKELDRRNDAAGAALRDALAGNPSLEMRRRVEGLLKNLEQYSLSSEQLRVVRAEQVLEMIGSPEAQAVLETLAAGAPGAGETREAAAALQRLKQR
jgi:WD40 repeat protein